MSKTEICHQKPPCDMEFLRRHMEEISEIIIPPLKERVDLSGYTEKLAKYADIFYAKNQEKVCGSCEVYLNQKRAYITSIAVFPEYQGRGIGSALLNAVVKEVEMRNIEEIDLEVFMNNIKAICFYKRHGFFAIEEKGKWIKMRKKIVKE